jgi:hypothetical protein
MAFKQNKKQQRMNDIESKELTVGGGEIEDKNFK